MPSPLLLALLPLAPQVPNVHFDTPLVTLDSLDAPYRLALDFDGDGDTDVLAMDKYHDSSSAYAAHELALHENIANGRLPLAWEGGFTSRDDRTAPAFVTAGNYLGDAREEIFYTWGREVRVFQWDPTSREAVEIGTNTNASTALDVVSADFNGDGHENPAVLLGNRVQIHVTSGGGITLVDVEIPDGPWSRLLSIDADGDGTSELLLVGPGRYAWIPLGRPRSHARASVVRLTTEHEMPAVGDIDGDGDEDAVVFGMTRYQVLRNVNGRLLVEPPVAGGPATGLADIDQDGDLDGVCCSGGDDGPNKIPHTNPSKFELCYNDGTGRFGPAFEIEAIGSKGLAAVLDLDLDGDVELVAGRVIYYGNGPIRPPEPELDAGRNREWRTLDMDGDGDCDLGVGAGPSAENLGNGTTTTSAPRLPVLAPPFSYSGPGIPGDFDADGDVDLLLDKWSSATYLGVFLLANEGGEVFAERGFAFALTFPLESFQYDGALFEPVDLDGDGRLDLLCPDWQNRIQWNDGPAGFSSTTIPESIAAAGDLDADGILDLVTSNRYTGTSIGVRKGLGGRAFGPCLDRYHSAGNTGFAGGWSRLALADLDGDGALDLVFPDSNSGLRGLQGIPGTLDFVWMNFSAPTWVDVRREGINRVFALDLDLDGQLELIGNFSGFHAWPDPNVSVVGKRSGGQWTWSRQIGTPLAFEDLDGDGDLDRIGTRLDKNRHFEGAAAGERLQFGAGLAGLGAVTPELGASGPFRPGETVTLRVVGGRGGAAATLVSGPTRVDWNQAGLPIYVDPADPDYRAQALALAGTAGAPGDGQATLSFVIPAFEAGRTTYYQVFVADPDAPGGTSASNGLALTVGAP